MSLSSGNTKYYSLTAGYDRSSILTFYCSSDDHSGGRRVLEATGEISSVRRAEQSGNCGTKYIYKKIKSGAQPRVLRALLFGTAGVLITIGIKSFELRVS